MEISKIHLQTVDSTSNHAHALLVNGEEFSDLTVIESEDQTAGRGQQGNSWETEAGKNLIFSIVCHPLNVYPAQQYVLSEAIALAVVHALACQLPPEMADNLSVKWPNDIYFGDKKISGTIIECDIMGKSIANSVIGTGVNINQKIFHSDAPNPISLYNIIGKEADRDHVMNALLEEFSNLYNRILQGDFANIHEEYKESLYRNDGRLYPYSDADGAFEARIINVEPSGRIILELASGEHRRYEFKEVKFVIEDM